jgi:deoxyribodipyrimidine photo-lyase
MQQTFEPSREAALRRLSAFLPRAGAAYAADRNYDHGPDRRGNISLLSPYLRHRLITEREVCAAVLEHHALQDAEKFIQEVFWRTYWKGLLEMRPDVWRRYAAGLARQLEALDRNGGLRRDHRAAIEGRTGIEGFDDWARELTATGYLHNHARMWFASIWIFTLRLPWELGADFFLRHLLDGDPASNTLSWRWVAGLHTRGKTYAATRDNIAKYTGGRFSPQGLAARAEALDEEPPPPSWPLAPSPARFDGECALLLTEEDFGVETLPLDWPRVRAIAVADMTESRTERGVAEAVEAFARGAAENTIGRSSALAPGARIESSPLRRISAGDILPWLGTARETTLVIPATPVGPAADAVDALLPALTAAGVRVVRMRRAWDAAAWPHAGKGFFGLKERIPDLLAREGLM